jgi:hypothetical protein
MVQEIIVYIILLATAVHLLNQTYRLFFPSKKKITNSACAGGSCSNCSLKIDLSSMKLDNTQIKSFHN